MTTTKKKRVYTGRNTGLFYSLITKLPDYNPSYKETSVDGAIDEYLIRKYGIRHGRAARLSQLSDVEYSELLKELEQKVYEGKSVVVLQQEAIRKDLTHKILNTLTRIGVTVINNDWSAVNYHILRLPISKGRIIPGFKVEELPKLLDAVRAYCDNVLKQQRKERDKAAKN